MSQPCCSLASLAGPGGEREAEKLVIRKEVLVVLTASNDVEPPPTPFSVLPSILLHGLDSREPSRLLPSLR